jgi:hypothetical protein
MTSRQLLYTVGVMALVPVFATEVRAEKFPRMVAALGELKEAAREMREAADDFGGHKEKALEATNRAITQMELALRAAGVDAVYVPPAREVYRGYRKFPHIHHALNELRLAHQEMKNAAHDFGGHKEKALEATSFAIAQLERALQFAK